MTCLLCVNFGVHFIAHFCLAYEKVNHWKIQNSIIKKYHMLHYLIENTF